MSFSFSRTTGAAFVFAAVALVGCSADDGSTPNMQSGGTTGVGGAATAGATSGGSGGATAGAAAGGAGAGAPSGGAATGGGGSSGAAGASGMAGAGGGAAGAGGGTSTFVACPADKTFCSGFEDTALPAGATYLHNSSPGEWTRDFEIDTTIFRHGKSALKVKGTGGTGALEMLAVPAPTSGPFWVRFYVRQEDADIGSIKHNIFGGASDSAANNSTVMVEVAEDVGLAFNSHDKVAWPKDYGRILGSEKPYTLAKGMWHCIEVQYDGQARTQKLYVGGVELINATEFPPDGAVSFTHFKFGMNAVNGPLRSVWYDDVAVGPTRAGCE